MADSEIYYGSSAINPESIWLKAGPLSLFFQEGSLRSIKYGSIEVIKRIYFAFRDENWNTISEIKDDLKVTQNDNSFKISYISKCNSNEIKFSYRAEIEGTVEGKIEFRIKGFAASSFLKNRIGLCTLHPIDLCAGRNCKVTTVNGTVYEKEFPIFIEPWQPFKEIRTLEYNVDGNTSIEVIFEGDVFEMEDQRNWTDYSFKTYSTPLSEPIPALVKKNDIIEQCVTIILKRPHNEEKEIPPETNQIEVPEISLLNKTVSEIGAMVSAEISPLVIERGEALSLNHLRFDIFAGSDALILESEKISSVCKHLRKPAELALHFSENLEEELFILEKVLATSQIPVHRFLIFEENENVTSADTIIRVSPVLKKYSQSAIIAAGTDNYFVDLNRKHPPSQFVDQICYSANPQVHTFDSIAVMENLPGIGQTLRSAQLLMGNARPIISPITLRPRKNRKNPKKAGGSDERQRGLFCSAWTTAALMQCIEGEAVSVTCFSLNGESGIMAEDGSSVYPVYHVLSSVTEMSGAAAGRCNCSTPNVHAMVFVRGIQVVLLIANVTSVTQKINVENLPSLIHCKYIDETTFYEITHFPEQWCCTKGTLISVDNFTHTFDLLPYGVLHIEASQLK